MSLPRLAAKDLQATTLQLEVGCKSITVTWIHVYTCIFINDVHSVVFLWPHSHTRPSVQ
jgi:hypothetical protein